MSDEPTFDTEAAKKVLENEKLDRKNRAARRLAEFVETLQDEERCIVFAVPVYTPDGRTIAQIAIDVKD